MKRIVLILLLLLITSISDAQYIIMGYYPNSAYDDYVIVYGYYESDGAFVISHCKTNVIDKTVFSTNKYYLDINTCTFKERYNYK
jgi:hypothetical protein